MNTKGAKHYNKDRLNKKKEKEKNGKGK